MRTGGSRTRSRARVGAIMAGGALAVPPMMMLGGAAANANPSAVRLLAETSTSAGAVAGPGYALGHTVRVHAEGGTAHHAVLRMLAADPLTWANRPAGCARLDSGRELRCDLGDVGGATVTRTGTVAVPASAVPRRAPGSRPAILTVAAADNAAPTTSRAVLDFSPGGESGSATADDPPAQPQPAPNEGDAHCSADAKPCQDAVPEGQAPPQQSAQQSAPQKGDPQCRGIADADRPKGALPASPCHNTPSPAGTAPAGQAEPAHEGRPAHNGRPPHHNRPPDEPRPALQPAPAKPRHHGHPSAQGQPAHPRPIKPFTHGQPHPGKPSTPPFTDEQPPAPHGNKLPHHSAPSRPAAPKHPASSQHSTSPQAGEPTQHNVTIYGDAPAGAAGGSTAHGHHTWSYGDQAQSETGVPWGAPGAGKHKHHAGASAGSVPSTEDEYPADGYPADAYPAGADGGAGYGGSAGGGHVKPGQVPELPAGPAPARPGVALPPLTAPGAMPAPNSQAMAGTTSDGTDHGDGRMTLVSPVGMEQGNGTDWAVVLGVAIVAEIGLLWGAACFGLWRRRIALYRAETRAAEARAEAAAQGGAYI
ncbi:hypothetical protein [Actinomadura verrucosospora]|uniref:Cell wall surface anchor family protein n=1 Tax=Actinomadura verrucosospora TaxID=46165 RepID=A0A7D3VW38_ACTVE|nr:hypothetical protein [Actinomadura verrucosospora]QKG24030.1 cell wall surface anchor family protein [Actinomadura verrucosospora]